MIKTPVALNEDVLKRKIMGCWLGKAVGGTLGMPYEGVDHRLNLTFYDPVPQEMLPNDDLDLQVVYAFLLDQMNPPRVDRHVLTQAWAHVGISPDEYGIAKRNLALGLKPPQTGTYDNPFCDGMGAAIRTEIWACLAAGNPGLAAAYAYEDACMDHAGEGIYAAQFLAALQALAFVESDCDILVNTALTQIPSDSLIAQSMTDTRAWWQQHHDEMTVYRLIMERYASDNFTDVKMNLPMILLGWLAGDGDFGRAICAAVNGGQDTDCTGATLGGLLGILDPDAIENRWLAPIGRDLVLSPTILGVQHPPTLDGFTDQVMDLRKRLNSQPPAVAEPESDDVSHLGIEAHLAYGQAIPDQLAFPDTAQRVTFEGTHTTWPTTHREPVLWVRYALTLADPGLIHLMFSSPDRVRVWINQQQVIDSQAGGPYVPAFHRCFGADQIVACELKSGPCELIAAIQRSDLDAPFRWTVGLADNPSAPVCRSWLADPFVRVKS